MSGKHKEMSEVEQIPDKNLFMMCPRLDTGALSDLPPGYHIRNCREDELPLWKSMPFDDPTEAKTHLGFMTRYFEQVYAPKGRLFYQRCLFVCTNAGEPIATGFIWRAYEELNTLHWLKVRKDYEGKGVGRALLSVLLRSLTETDYPVYLHTQPESYRAVKLYTDFGFVLLTDPVIGGRRNDLAECLPILAKHMPPESFRRLRTAKAPEHFVQQLKSEQHSEF